MAVNWNELVKFTNEGVYVATYQEMKSAIITRFKEIYGDDIDVSSRSADGIFLETYCLILQNLLESVKTFFNQFDIDSASGKQLDNLCKLSNVYRKQATYSTVVCMLTNNDSVDYEFEKNAEGKYFFTVVSNDGTTWTYSSTSSVTLAAGKSMQLVFTCDELGTISAPMGSITKALTSNANIAVTQQYSASIGTLTELDSELKARQNLNYSANGQTVIEALTGALIATIGIKDAKVYNIVDKDDATITSAIVDGVASLLKSHAIYVIIRKDANASISDNDIGTLIYENITPGIGTIDPGSSVESGTQKYTTYTDASSSGVVTQIVYWKEAKPAQTNVEIVLNTYNGFAAGMSEQAKDIAEATCKYLNNLQLCKNIEEAELKTVILASDRRYRSASTFNIASVTFPEENKNSYFSYSYEEDTTHYNASTITTDGRVRITLTPLSI